MLRYPNTGEITVRNGSTLDYYENNKTYGGVYSDLYIYNSTDETLTSVRSDTVYGATDCVRNLSDTMFSHMFFSVNANIWTTVDRSNGDIIISSTIPFRDYLTDGMTYSTYYKYRSTGPHDYAYNSQYIEYGGDIYYYSGIVPDNNMQGTFGTLEDGYGIQLTATVDPITEEITVAVTTNNPKP